MSGYIWAMMARNHIPFAMSSWWLVAIATGQPIEVQSTMTAAIGGLLPDLDHPESALGRRFLLISVPLASIFGHRGFTHSLLAVTLLLGLLIAIMMLPGYGYWAWLVAPLIIGYLSHILGDSMTPSGVPLFWPKKRSYSFNFFKTWSWQESAFVGVITLGMLTVGGVANQVFNDALGQMPGGYVVNQLAQRVF
ncbi:MAG: metal-dependent hydrolase [Cyanobacteria bacterium P01_D01_bin.156]